MSYSINNPILNEMLGYEKDYPRREDDVLEAIIGTLCYARGLPPIVIEPILSEGGKNTALESKKNTLYLHLASDNKKQVSLKTGKSREPFAAYIGTGLASLHSLTKEDISGIAVWTDEENQCALISFGSTPYAIEDASKMIVSSIIHRLFPHVVEKQVLNNVEERMMHRCGMQDKIEVSQALDTCFKDFKLLIDYIDSQRLAESRRFLSTQKEMIDNMECANLDNQIKDWSYTKTDLANNLATLEKKYFDTLQELRNVGDKIFAMEKYRDSKSSNSELFDFLFQNNSIQVQEVKKRGFDCVVADTLKYWDADKAQTTCSNIGFFNKYMTSQISAKDLQKVFKAIFIDEEVELATVVPITVTNHTITAHSPSAEIKNKYKSYAYHPHLGRSSPCWGDAMQHISPHLKEGNIIGALNQAVAATWNINFGDAVVNDFFKNIWTTVTWRNKIIYRIDGAPKNLQEVIEHVNKG